MWKIQIWGKAPRGLGQNTPGGILPHRYIFLDDNDKNISEEE